ncbi:hypothetical protein ACK1CN_25020 [Vibrio coralliilyticus]|uniref:hypothetical protein n=1 Tax=Vibrio coralliilyticus TaxID=190893 RepID=UPI003917217B
MLFSPSKIAAYSPSKKSTYEKNSSWPDDLIEFLDGEYETYFLSLPPEGKEVGVDENSRPCWVDVAPLTKAQASIIEIQWRDAELTKVLNRIDQYEKDQNYPEELRTSPIKSNEDFLKLLEDRKMLSDYPNNESFPFGERPQLSGLAN